MDSQTLLIASLAACTPTFAMLTSLNQGMALAARSIGPEYSPKIGCVLRMPLISEMLLRTF